MKSLYVTHILEQEAVALGGLSEKTGGIFIRVSASPHGEGQFLDIEIDRGVLEKVVALASEQRITSLDDGPSLLRQEMDAGGWGPDMALEDYADPRAMRTVPETFQADEDLETPDHDDDLATFSPVE
jgi:hypothetical protein